MGDNTFESVKAFSVVGAVFSVHNKMFYMKAREIYISMIIVSVNGLWTSFVQSTELRFEILLYNMPHTSVDNDWSSVACFNTVVNQIHKYVCYVVVAQSFHIYESQVCNMSYTW